MRRGSVHVEIAMSREAPGPELSTAPIIPSARMLSGSVITFNADNSTLVAADSGCQTSARSAIAMTRLR